MHQLFIHVSGTIVVAQETRQQHGYHAYITLQSLVDSRNHLNTQWDRALMQLFAPQDTTHADSMQKWLRTSVCPRSVGDHGN